MKYVLAYLGSSVKTTIMSWEWHMKENHQGRFHAFARADRSLRKGAFHSIRESEICFVLRIKKRNYKLKFSGLTVKKVSFPIIEPVSCLKQSIFWNVGRISDFMDWNVQRDAGTLVQQRSFFSKTAFSHKVWPIHLKFMNNFDV